MATSSPRSLNGLDFAVEVRLVHVAERDDLGAGDLAEPGE